jgi:hypothetical protein
MLIKHIQILCLTVAKALVVAALLGIGFSAGGCGKRKPPQPPAERIGQRAEISGFQRGNRVNLSWRLPSRNAVADNLLNIDRVEVYRLAEPTSNSPALDEEEFAARATIITSLPITSSDFARGLFTFTDTLQFAGQSARLRYAVRFVNREGQRAAFSNFLLIEPAARVSESPTDLKAQITEEYVSLNWVAPEKNIDGSKPVNLLGYNVYRSPADSAEFKILNQSPVTKNDYADSAAAFGENYKYFVRSVSLGTGGEPVESLESNTVAVEPRDIFAPSAPAALTIAAAPKNISIFFAFNPERDVVGYRVYRSTNPNAALDQWQLLTPEILSSNTFQDKTVESGQTYFYYLTAIDKAGNVSQPSEIISETAP